MIRTPFRFLMSALFVLGAQVLMARVEAQPHEMTFSSGAGKASLIELYTSEGCSSCPPAEAWLGSLKNSPKLWTEVFPLSFHVDYWDELGWPDRFASPNYTQRQRDYAARLGQDSIYTPEFVVDGAEFRGWFHGQSLPHPGAGRGELKVVVRDGKVSGNYVAASDDSARDCVLNVAVLGMGLVTDVKAGENDGRQLKHDFIVLGFRSVPLVQAGKGEWRAGPMEIKSSTRDSPAAVVGWVSGSTGQILQVAGGWTTGTR